MLPVQAESAMQWFSGGHWHREVHWPDACLSIANRIPSLSDSTVTHSPSIGAPMLPVQGESAMQTVFGRALALGGALA